MSKHRIYNPLIVLLVFVVAGFIQLGQFGNKRAVGGRHSAVDRYVFPSIGRQIDAPIHDAYLRARNQWFEQPISPDVTLVGIDDYTESKLGKFGTGDWLTREPFRKQLRYFANAFHPSVISYDIIFKKVKQDGEDDLAVSEDPAAIARIQKSLEGVSGGGTISDNVALLSMAHIANEQGDLNLAAALNEAFHPDEPMESRITTILAYNFGETSNRKWTIEDILGDDPDDLAEDYGLEVPYLKDVHIPEAYVSGAEAYPWFDFGAALPTNVYLDYGRLGYINVPRDEDGIVRRIPMIIGMRYAFIDPETKKETIRRVFLPSMSLLSCLAYWGIDLTALHSDDAFVQDGVPTVSVELGNEIRVRKPDGQVVRIPIDEHGRFLLDYVGQIREFSNIPFASTTQFSVAVFNSALRAKADPEMAAKIDAVVKENAGQIASIRNSLNRKLVMIGLTATAQSDIGPCPINTNTPFVHVHMTAASNILTGTYLRPASSRLDLLVLVIVGVLMMLSAAILRPVQVSYAAIVIMLVYVGASFFAVVLHWRQLPVLAPLGVIAVSYLVLILVYYLTEAKERRRVRGMFSTMVSGEVLNYMEDNPDSFSLGGERRDASIFFSDLAGFTTISENLPADQLVELLNEYLSPMTEIIMSSQGFVDKYIGDAIMAVWGVPYPEPDHARLACYSALEQQKKILEMSDRFKTEYGVDVIVRMGINSGTVVAGNMGSSSRLSYTVMGDAVNQAARYEPANKDYDTLIMIGESTFQLAREHIEARLLDRIVVKGKSVPIQVYELMAKSGELPEEKERIVALYHQALEVHWTRQWDRALELLREALEIDPKDGPSIAMIERIEAYKLHPPPDSWQGEFVRTKK